MSALFAATFALSSTPALLVAADTQDRHVFTHLAAGGSGSSYLGFADDVSATNGFALSPTSDLSFRLAAGQEVWGTFIGTGAPTFSVLVTDT